MRGGIECWVLDHGDCLVRWAWGVKTTETRQEKKLDSVLSILIDVCILVRLRGYSQAKMAIES